MFLQEITKVFELGTDEPEENVCLDVKRDPYIKRPKTELPTTILSVESTTQLFLNNKGKVSVPRIPSILTSEKGMCCLILDLSSVSPNLSKKSKSTYEYPSKLSENFFTQAFI